MAKCRPPTPEAQRFGRHVDELYLVRGAHDRVRHGPPGHISLRWHLPQLTPLC